MPARLHPGDAMLFDIAMPEWAGFVTLVHIGSDGVASLLEATPRQQAASRLRLGTPRLGFSGWSADEPFGTDLVLAVVSEAPLLPATHPPQVPVQDFAAALRGAVAAARASGTRVSADMAVVEIAPR
jgi:hypothetical protein